MGEWNLKKWILTFCLLFWNRWFSFCCYDCFWAVSLLVKLGNSTTGLATQVVWKWFRTIFIFFFSRAAKAYGREIKNCNNKSFFTKKKTKLQCHSENCNIIPSFLGMLSNIELYSVAWAELQCLGKGCKLKYYLKMMTSSEASQRAVAVFNFILYCRFP